MKDDKYSVGKYYYKWLGGIPEEDPDVDLSELLVYIDSGRLESLGIKGSFIPQLRGAIEEPDITEK